MDGLAESIEELKNANVGLSEDQIMAILLTNQYLDTLNTFASNGNQTLFLPSGPSAVDDIRTQMLSALKAAGTHAPAVERTHDLEELQGE